MHFRLGTNGTAIAAEGSVNYGMCRYGYRCVVVGKICEDSLHEVDTLYRH
jgi:hypothetical protein